MVLWFSSMSGLLAVYIDEVLNYIRRHEGNISATGTITDLISNLEYNRTLANLHSGNFISNQEYQKGKAANYCKTAGYYLERKRYKRSNVLFQNLSEVPRLVAAALKDVNIREGKFYIVQRIANAEILE